MQTALLCVREGLHGSNAKAELHIVLAAYKEFKQGSEEKALSAFVRNMLSCPNGKFMPCQDWRSGQKLLTYVKPVSEGYWSYTKCMFE